MTMKKTTLAAAAAVLLFFALEDGTRADLSTVMVPMPDGVRLATDVHTPDAAGPWPVILSRTPYSKDGMVDIGSGLIALGYAFVAQDTRGRYASEGTDSVFFDDAVDGRATLEWIADQPFCDGNIGTYGGSALGITQLLLAPGAPPELKCQAIFVGTPDFYAQALFQGGSFRASMVERWLEGQESSYVLPGWEDHSLLSDYWDPVRIVERYAQVDVPALHIGGWFDIFTQGTLDSFSGYDGMGGPLARGSQYVIVGPWIHDLSAAAAGDYVLPENARLIDEINLDTIAWFDHCLKGRANEVDAWPRVRYYRMGDFADPSAPGHAWVEADAWPPEAPVVPYYLHGDGSLSEDLPGDEGATSFTYDPLDPVRTLCGALLFGDEHPGTCDQAPLASRPDVLVFETGPLAEPVEVTGRIVARLFVSSDAPDTDVTAKLLDIRPDGTQALVTDGILRVRHRGGQDSEAFLAPGEIVSIEVDLWSTSLVFDAGHRIGLQISSSNFPRFDTNPNTGLPFRADDTTRTAVNTIHHAAGAPSALLLPMPGHPPVVEPEPETETEAVEPVETVEGVPEVEADAAEGTPDAPAQDVGPEAGGRDGGCGCAVVVR